ncbi:MAG: C40 family peptidase, partial [Bacteroidales bacterium]|nr:C40 family peptidase [Bacteroidales bacterium]
SYTLAPPGALQRSLYIEKPAVKGKPAVFSYRARFHSAAQWFDPRRLHAEPYDTTTELYHKFTAERPPQVIFSPLVRETADRIVGGETDPFKIVKKLYYWINENIPWASALEYSIMDCIPDYVLTYRHGDCGMQTFLLIYMCRYKGIPARWQSGWHVHPGNKNLHDWSEVYFQGTGWVPVDVSFGLQDSDDPLVRNFYLTGMDAYRMIVNDDFSIPFTPAKKYERSEPYDFQRGEVEWRGGNLYFNQWTYQMDVTSRTGDLSRALVDVSVCNLRTRPGHSQELSSQALMGTPLRVLKKKGSWYQVQTPEQYVTWVDAPAITLLSEQEMEAWKKSRRVVFTGEFGEVKNPEPPYNVVSDLTMGCILQVVRESGQSLIVRLPDGRSGMIPQKNTVPVKAFAAQRYPDFAPIISMAETFMGRPYLWGGTSARGIDCSGFMKTLFLMHGVILSRDAWQQAKHGKEVVFSGDDRVLQPGDLLFFGRRATDTKPEKVTHVALYIGDGKFIHSSGRVKINSLRSTDPDYSSYLKSILLHVRRIHQLDTPNGPWSMQHHKWYF